MRIQDTCPLFSTPLLSATGIQKGTKRDAYLDLAPETVRQLRRYRNGAWKTTDAVFQLNRWGLALLVAVIHLFHPQLGFPRLIQHLQLGTLYDPRPLVFTISGLAIIVGVLLVYNGVARKRVYLLGIAMMITYLAGYVGWHTVLDHATSWLYIEYPGHFVHPSAIYNVLSIIDLVD